MNGINVILQQIPMCITDKQNHIKMYTLSGFICDVRSASGTLSSVNLPNEGQLTKWLENLIVRSLIGSDRFLCCREKQVLSPDIRQSPLCHSSSLCFWRLFRPICVNRSQVIHGSTAALSDGIFSPRWHARSLLCSLGETLVWLPDLQEPTIPKSLTSPPKTAEQSGEYSD